MRFLFSFKGRVNRQPFWAFMLVGGLIWFLLSLLLGIDITKRGDSKSLIPTLILLWPSLAVQAKRWHDRDKSAWWILINIIPIAGPLWALIENGCLVGTSSQNRFGDDPLGGGSTVSDAVEDISSQKVIPALDRMPQKYYLSLIKALIIFGCVMALFSSFIMMKISALTSIETPGGVIPFVILDSAIIAMLIWRLRTPVIDISETGLKLAMLN